MSKQAMKLALEAMESKDTWGSSTREAKERAITALREALAEQPAQGCDYCNHPLYVGIKCKNCGREQPAQQEPVAVVSGYYGGQCVILPIDPARIFNSNTPLYTSPPAQRKPLTDEQIKAIHNELCGTVGSDYETISRAIEAAHGIGEKK